ncbi:MAG TPA: hypothetical protein VF167_06940 [Longimicrobiaceae bacterium]
MPPPTTPGYSGRSLAQKLGIKEGSSLLAVGAPPDYLDRLGALPANAAIVERIGPAVDIVHLFVTRRADMEGRLRALREQVRPDAAVWVSWPKKSSGVETDISENIIREVALPLGFVDVKVCAVTEVWSGLKLVVRKTLR